MSFLSVRGLARRAVYVPWVAIPEGRMVELPGRGSTYVTDTPGPHPDSPTVLLLHAVGCTGLLTWFPSIGALSTRFRVVTMDQRWHGRGVQSEEFSLYDCADDAAALLDVLEVEQAIVVGFSMGSIVSQRVWRQHPERVAGLVLCATTDRFRRSPYERVFHQGMEFAMVGARGLSRSRTAVRATRTAAEALDLTPPTSTTGRSASSGAPARGRSARPWPPSAGTTPAPGCPGSTYRPPWSSPTTTG